jgi:hypothetical protein
LGSEKAPARPLPVTVPPASWYLKCAPLLCSSSEELSIFQCFCLNANIPGRGKALALRPEKGFPGLLSPLSTVQSKVLLGWHLPRGPWVYFQLIFQSLNTQGGKSSQKMQVSTDQVRGHLFEWKEPSFEANLVVLNPKYALVTRMLF